ncbi:MAG: hypothetical protein AAGA83_24460 [Cyanobacteria bacterium P01_F01_bin.116]
MTSSRPGSNLEQRLNQLEVLMDSAGRLLIQASDVAQRNAADIEALTRNIQRNAIDIQALTQRMDSLTQRVDSLTAASERHDRILDYLLRREAGEIDEM